MALDERIEVHPGHGAGSLCGAGIGKEPLHDDRRRTPAQPDAAARDARGVRRRGAGRHSGDAAVLRADEAPEPGRAAAAAACANGYRGLVRDVAGRRRPRRAAAAARCSSTSARRRGVRAPDTRRRAQHRLRHEGRLLGRLGAACTTPASCCVAAGRQRRRPRLDAQLLRVGLDRASRGYVNGGFEAWRAAGLPIARAPRSSVAERPGSARLLRQQRLGPLVVDVRDPREWSAGHIDGCRAHPARRPRSARPRVAGRRPRASPRWPPAMLRSRVYRVDQRRRRSRAGARRPRPRS